MNKPQGLWKQRKTALNVSLDVVLMLLWKIGLLSSMSFGKWVITRNCTFMEKQPSKNQRKVRKLEQQAERKTM
jgi:hypothetical protein